MLCMFLKFIGSSLEAITYAQKVLHIRFMGANGRGFIEIADSLESHKNLLSKVSTDTHGGCEKIIGELLYARIVGKILCELNVLGELFVEVVTKLY